MAKRKIKEEKNEDLDGQGWLDDRLKPKFDKVVEHTELGWGILKTETTTEIHTGEVTSRTQTLDLLPGSGLVLDGLHFACFGYGVDEVVHRLRHCDELAAQIKVRKASLTERLTELMAGANRVVGLECEARWEEKRVLAYGAKREEAEDVEREEAEDVEY